MTGPASAFYARRVPLGMSPLRCARAWIARGSGVAWVLCLGTAFLATALVTQGADAPRPPLAQPLEPHSRSPGRSAGFTARPPAETGITFTNRLDEERSLTNQIFLNGSGVALGDVDGDGRCDVYLCGLDTPNALYRNLGSWRFVDVTTTAGVACADQASTGAAFADLDGDGDLDLLVNGIARGTRLFLNDGHGKFTEATRESGLASSRGSTSFAIADVDGDGRPDVYVVNYRSDTLRDQPGVTFTVGVTNGVRQLLAVNGRPATDPDLAGRYSFDPANGVLENGEPDVLFRNLGGGKFAAVAWGGPDFLDESGRPTATPYDWGLSALFRDLTGDGAPDLYVCNDFQSPDRFWINDGRGHFRAAPRMTLRQTSLFSMGADVADIDRDGFDDLFVADMLSRRHLDRQVQVLDPAAFAQIRNTAGDRPQFSRNTLFRNRGNGTFAEIAQLAGVDASDWTWCPVFLDVDLDGFEDLLLTTGHWRDAQNADMAKALDRETEQRHLSPREQLRQRRRFPRLETPNVAFRNRGDLTFAEVGAAWGFDSRRIAQGIALADLDGDGDLDAVINCLNNAPLLLRNDATAPRVTIQLRGRAPNTAGLGAHMQVQAPGLPPQIQEMVAGGRYLSSDAAERVFAVRQATDRIDVTVTWRNGRVSHWPQLAADQRYTFEEPAAESADAAPAPTLPVSPADGLNLPNGDTFFEELSHLLGHQHVDETPDDFVLQPLLPHAQSRLGPPLAWFDFNGDGWEDLLLGAGRGGRLTVLRNNTQTGFVPQRARLLDAPVTQPHASLLGWRTSATNLVLALGLGRSQPSGPPEPGLRLISLVTGATDDSLWPTTTWTGPLALADTDGDGDLDLFVGGRYRPGRYPEPVASGLLRQHDGAFAPAPENAGLPLVPGMLHTAIFTELDDTPGAELVVAGEWGALQVFRNRAGRFSAWDPALTWPGERPGGSTSAPPSRLSACTGGWNSVVAGDFDGDGRLDLAAGNWGRNTARQAFLEHPLRLTSVELDGPDGPLGLVESHVAPELGREVPVRDRTALGAVFPALLAHFPTFAEFAAAPLSEVLAALPPGTSVEARVLDSLVLLNRGDHFAAYPLPTEAQIAPIFGLAVADVDGDGHEDLVAAQNFFATSPAESRLDAGGMVWLRGDGRGGFQAITAARSGLTTYGEGRGVAVADFDHDGRPDFAVAQHRGLTRLFHNLAGRPARRLILRGGPGNPDGLGARARAEYADGTLGPQHEIHAGSGSGSQDAPVVLLAAPQEVAAVIVTWPDGTAQRAPWPAGATTLTLERPPLRR